MLEVPECLNVKIGMGKGTVIADWSTAGRAGETEMWKGYFMSVGVSKKKSGKYHASRSATKPFNTISDHLLTWITGPCTHEI
jgi:hypothetical protein